MKRVTHFARSVWLLVSLPTTLLHELTHWAAGLRWATESAVFYENGEIGHVVNWSDDVPDWAPIVTSLAPTLLGALIGLIGLWRLVTVQPETFEQLATAAIASIYWGIYCLPQGDDLVQKHGQNETMQDTETTEADR